LAWHGGLWHAPRMRPPLPLRLAPLALLAACHTPAPAAPPAEAAPAEPAAAAPPAAHPADHAAAMQQELRGAPFARERSASLSVVVPREPSGADADGRARRAFEALTPEEQADLLDWFTVECEKLRTFQVTLIQYVVRAAERDPASWPALEASPWYDAKTHSPGQPIPREPLAAEANEVVAVRNQILAAVGTRRLDSGWMVDYAQRGLVRLPHQKDPRRVFENALLGMAPDWDLAEALVELGLDDGTQQKGFQAFAHAYTDRWGGVYPGVTLYDAYASQTTVEMPDVDTLGLVHELLGDWDTWKAPVPAEQHEALYSRIADIFRPLLRHRGLRANLARTYLCGSAELRDSYSNNLDNFHALWESVASEPAQLKARLPDAEGWAAFLQGWDDTLNASPELFLKGTSRHATLERDAQRVRATLLRLLGEYGAFARIETLPPFDQ